MRIYFWLAAALLACSVSATGQIQSATLKADGLTCSMCSKAIYKALSRLSFVEKVDVDLETSVYTILFRKGSAVSPDLLQKAVKDAGFSVGRMSINALFNNETVANDAHLDFAGATYHFLDVPQQTLRGMRTLVLLDKGFTSAAQRKHYRAYTGMNCYETGMAGTCCSKSSKASSRVYHVTLLS